MKTFQKPLTAGEEAYYLELKKNGDVQEAKRAKDILVERNMRLVAHIIKKYQNSGEETEDLISIGCIGLIKAIDSFDVKRGRLATYACKCIENELLMMLRGKKKTSKEVSLFEPIGHDKEGNEIQLMDIIEQQQFDVIEDMDRKEKIIRLSDCIDSCLTNREKKILSLRYGLGGEEPLTQSEIGELFGISRSYVSRIEKKALNKLKIQLDNR